MKTITIKEVYEQLKKYELGTPKAAILLDGVEYIVTGCSGIRKTDATRSALMVEVISHDFHRRDAILENTEVEWIGNQPKKKMLYACILWSGSTKSSGDVHYQDKNNPTAAYGMEWLPEEQYPPIEIEEQ